MAVMWQGAGLGKEAVKERVCLSERMDALRQESLLESCFLLSLLHVSVVTADNNREQAMKHCCPAPPSNG